MSEEKTRTWNVSGNVLLRSMIEYLLKEVRDIFQNNLYLLNVKILSFF